ncbi:MAG: hypothetical protein HYU66_28270 [Armatimonadetes bacterium]|nr:hypothetical protein [Armatimonadota bacterium]
MEFQEQLRQFLTEAFPGAEIDYIRQAPRTGRVGASLAWTGFEDVGMLERQNRVWDALRERFTREELRQVAMVFAWTPRELQAIHEDA